MPSRLSRVPNKNAKSQADLHHAPAPAKQGQKPLSPALESDSYVNTSTFNVGPKPMQANQPDNHLTDCENLTCTALAAKYWQEYNSWRGAKGRSKESGLDFDRAFIEFRSFLRLVGPIPTAGMSLDRIDNKRGYVTDNVRWATKREQGRNKSNVQCLIHQGERLPLVEWAERTGQKADTLRKRKNARWSDEDTITGRRHTAPLDTALAQTPWPPNTREKWEHLFQTRAGSRESREEFYLRYALEQRRQAIEICKHYALDDNRSSDDTRLYLHWESRVQDAWEKLQPKMQRDQLRRSVRGRLPTPEELALWEASVRNREVTHSLGQLGMEENAPDADDEE